MNLSSSIFNHCLDKSKFLYLLLLSLGHAIPLSEIGISVLEESFKVKKSVNIDFAIKPHGIAAYSGSKPLPYVYSVKRCLFK